jgi:diguanylate cyclase (GGDEF)-like protein
MYDLASKTGNDRVERARKLLIGDLKFLLAVLILFLGCLFAGPATAKDLILSRAILEDSAGTLAIEDIVNREPTPFEASRIMPVSDTARWVRLRIRAPDEGGKVVLFIRPTYLNDVRLYQADPTAPNGWTSRATGNIYPYEARDRQRISLGFVINVTAPEETVYLRIKVKYHGLLNIEAITPIEAEQRDFDRDLLIVFFVTAMSTLFLWSIHSYFLDRQRVFAVFAIHQFFYTLFGISITGYLAPFASSQFPWLVDTLGGVFYISIGLTMTLFCRELLKPYDPRPLIRWGFLFLLALFSFNLITYLAGYKVTAFMVNGLSTKIMLIYFAVASFFLQTERSPRRIVIQFLFAFILINNIAFWVPAYFHLNVNIVKWSSIQVLFLDGFLIACLFAVMAYVRARDVRREARETAEALAIINRNLQEEIERKDQAQTEARTDFLTGLFNRRHFFELAQRELDRSTRYQHPFSLLMIDIDHFKSINDTWGHNFGDEVLRTVAWSLRDTLRSVDIFGRTGGEEFAAVIVETSETEAVDIAHRIRSAVEEKVLTAPDGSTIRVTVSIGITHLRGREIGFDSVMNEADQAMYAAKKTGRNRIMVNG